MDEEAVRRRAYELWELNGKPEGKDLEFWLIAEREAQADAEVDEGLKESFPASDPPSSVMRR